MNTLPTPDTTHNPAVLIVDDDGATCYLTSLILEEIGCRVVVASNGKEGVDAVRREAFDVIFMDLKMPIVDGCEAAKTIRELEGPARQLAIVAFTADALHEYPAECLKAMDDFLRKPCTKSELIEKCQYWMNRR